MGLNKQQLLTSFATHFKNSHSRLLTQMEQEANSLIDLKGQDFILEQPICPDITMKTLLAYYRDLGMHREIAQVEKLSAREKQCLKLLIKDKTAKETASILELSPRTVEFYFENIKNKLHCENKYAVLQIARKLEEMGLL